MRRVPPSGVVAPPNKDAPAALQWPGRQAGGPWSRSTAWLMAWVVLATRKPARTRASPSCQIRASSRVIPMPSWKAPASWTKWVCRGKPAASANQLGASSAATPAAVMNSPASRATARTKRRPRSIGRAGDHSPVGLLMVLWPWVLMALVLGSVAAGEGSDGASQGSWLVDGKQGPAVGDLDEPRLGKRRGQPPAGLDRHHLVLGGPDDQDRLGKARQARVGLDQLPPALPGVAGVLAQVGSDRRLGQGRLQPLVEQLVGDRALGHQAEGHRQPPQRRKAQSLKTSVTSCSSSRSRNSASRWTWPRSDRSASGCIGRRWAPSGSVGRTHRKPGPSSFTTASQSEAVISSPWHRTITGPSPPVSSYRIDPADSSTSVILSPKAP